jgi:hypothetical protein
MPAHPVNAITPANIAEYAILCIIATSESCKKPYHPLLGRIQHWPHKQFSHILAGLAIWVSLSIEVHGALGYDSCTACER